MWDHFTTHKTHNTAATCMQEAHQLQLHCIWCNHTGKPDIIMVGDRGEDSTRPTSPHFWIVTDSAVIWFLIWLSYLYYYFYVHTHRVKLMWSKLHQMLKRLQQFCMTGMVALQCWWLTRLWCALYQPVNLSWLSLERTMSLTLTTPKATTDFSLL